MFLSDLAQFQNALFYAFVGVWLLRPRTVGSEAKIVKLSERIH